MVCVLYHTGSLNIFINVQTTILLLSDCARVSKNYCNLKVRKNGAQTWQSVLITAQLIPLIIVQQFVRFSEDKEKFETGVGIPAGFRKEPIEARLTCDTRGD